MAFEEKYCLIIDWKIKNFSYCWTKIKSPEFTYNSKQCWLEIDPKCQQYEISCMYTGGRPYVEGCISFLTCDGTQNISSTSQTRIAILGLVIVSKDAIFGERRSAFLPKDTLTIRCQFYVDDPTRGKVYIHSRIGVKRKCLFWTLKNFSPEFPDETLVVEKSDLYGNIQLNLRSVGGINCDKQFYIEISRRGGEKCYSVLKVSVMDVEGNSVNYVSDEFVFEKEGRDQSWRFPPVIKNSILLSRKTMLLPSNTLSLKCDFAISLGKVTEQTAFYSHFGSTLPHSEDPSVCFRNGILSDSVTDLKTDLKTLLDNGTLCDVTLQVDSDVIKAHKTLLSARSPVFKAMFTKDMKETIDKKVVIEDLDADTVRRLLLYMYSDTIQDYQWENIMNLYFAADKYEVLSLKQKCSSFLNANLSLSNICEVLVLADLHQDTHLKSVGMGFISKYESEVFASEAWRELEINNSALACLTLREVCSKKRLN